MDISHVIYALRRHWVTAALTSIFLFAAVLGFTLIQGSTYSSYARIMAAPAITRATDRTSSLDAWRGTQIQVQSFPGLITSGVVLGPVTQDVKTTLSPQQLARQIRTDVPVDALYMDITVSSNSADLSAAIARSLVARFVERYTSLNTQAQTPLSLYVVNQPQVPAYPASPDKRLTLIAATAVAAIGAVLAALLRWRLARFINDIHDIAMIAGPVSCLLVADDEPFGAYRVVVAQQIGARGHAQEQSLHKTVKKIALVPTAEENTISEAHALFTALQESGIDATIVNVTNATPTIVENGAESTKTFLSALSPAIRNSPLSLVELLGRGSNQVIFACAPVREDLQSDAYIASSDAAIVHVTKGRSRRATLRDTVQMLASVDVPLHTIIFHCGRKVPR